MVYWTAFALEEWGGCLLYGFLIDFRKIKVIFACSTALCIALASIPIANSVMTAAQNLEVSGGTVSLTDGTVNAMGDVTFAADSKIAFGKGAKLDFRSLTLAEGVKLAVVNEDRFGGFSVARRLTGEELARLTVNGCRAFQSATGKIREKRGSVIYLR